MSISQSNWGLDFGKFSGEIGGISKEEEGKVWIFVLGFSLPHYWRFGGKVKIK